jgi:predicted TIM-barrel fold metal-dependent hydrolase
MDYTVSVFKGKRNFTELPSKTAKQRLKVAPFAGEPVGWIMENASSEMLVFASDYPHPEGTSDPFKKFEATMESCDSKPMEAFYYGDLAELLGLS